MTTSKVAWIAFLTPGLGRPGVRNAIQATLLVVIAKNLLQSAVQLGGLVTNRIRKEKLATAPQMGREVALKYVTLDQVPGDQTAESPPVGGSTRRSGHQEPGPRSHTSEQLRDPSGEQWDTALLASSSVSLEDSSLAS
jgi:hypothetical protein